jgi:DNA helicase-4
MFELLNGFLFESIIAVEIIVIILLVTIVAYYFRRKSKRIKKIQTDLDLLEEDILNAEKEFKIEYNKDLYFSKKTLHFWKEKWKHVEAVVERFSSMRHGWRVQAIDNTDLLDSILYVNQIFANGMDLVKERNSAFIERECVAFRALFDSLESYSLTPSQCRSIITDECNNLVVAGAGSGKTTTIVGKAKYIVEKGLAKPEEILLLAFAREAKKEMEERMSSRLTVQPDIKTFHALGLRIIAKSEGIQPSVTKLKDPSKLRQFIRRIISLDEQHRLDEFADEPIAEDKEKDLHELLTTYFAYYLRPYRSVFKFTSLGEYIDYIKENQIRSLKGDLVKSYEECEIANFLYLNGINYDYERDYEVLTASRERRQYKPDFYLPDYRIYIEHFGINKKGEPAPFVNAEEYLREMAWKKSIHKKQGTTLIETFSYEKTDGVLLFNLEKTLKSYGVKFLKESIN